MLSVINKLTKNGQTPSELPWINGALRFFVSFRVFRGQNAGARDAELTTDCTERTDIRR
jgi:hypothetical protein